MRLTNKHKLPPELIAAKVADPYDSGGADISVTTLIDSPRIALMREIHEPEVDISNAIWPLLGQAFHSLMEGGSDPDVIHEERMFAEIEGWTVSGKMDRQETHRGRVKISDYKVTSAWKIKHGHAEWKEQLNCYAWLYHEKHGVLPDELEIIALCRDWREREKSQRGYPEQPIVRIPIDLKSLGEIRYFVRTRVKLHQAARKLYESAGELVPCSDGDRWGGTKRCEKWCEFSHVCKQYEDMQLKRMLKEIE